MFVDPENYDFSLQEGSPAIESGRYGEDRGAVPFVPTGINDDPKGIPLDYSMIAAYPNPFNSSANLEFYLPEDGKCSIDVYNILGQKECSLVDEDFSKGYNTIRWNASDLQSGVYFLRLTSGDYQSMTRAVLVK
ncbi:MAG: T9SS type A sorting domain-containing protein [candidate division Zixibacteria bacterium]|nr:T9SS type A sorting domain-containing protein [candidate division Zixibacteria bacterium]